MRISDWSSDVCSSDLIDEHLERPPPAVLDDVVECDVDGVIALRPLDLIGTAWQRFGTLHRQRGFPLLRRARWGGDGEDGTGDPVGPVCRAAFAAAVPGQQIDILEGVERDVLEIGRASCRERVCQYV